MNQEALTLLQALGDNALIGFVIHEAIDLMWLLMVVLGARAIWPTLKGILEDV